jgi:hypothetical protein
MDGIEARASRWPIQKQSQESSLKSEWQTWRKAQEGLRKLARLKLILSAPLRALSGEPFVFGFQNYKLQFINFNHNGQPTQSH